MPEPIRLNLGSGKTEIPGFISVDRMFGSEVYPLNHYVDETVECVRASHILEHFPHGQAQEVLNEWVRVLKPGGVLKVAVPDFEWICRQYLAMKDENGPAINIQGYVMGGQTDANDFHKCLFDEHGLRAGMERAGLVDIEPWESETDDCAAMSVSLNLMGRKPEGIPARAEEGELTVREAEYPFLVNGEGFCPRCGEELPNTWNHPGKCSCGLCEWSSWDGGRIASIDGMDSQKWRTLHQRPQAHTEPQVTFDRTNAPIVAVMSCPRLGFMANQFCCLQLSMMGIPVESVGGVFWGQALTKAILRHMDVKYILTLDYDSVFTVEDVMALYRIMETRPEIDALASLQVRREKETPLVTVAGEDGRPRTEIHRDELGTETIRVRTAHFGLTLLRVESLQTFPHPWFVAKPDPDGLWGDLKLDEDVFFWHKWHEQGRTLHIANRVAVGHLQLMVTWPDSNLVSRSQFMTEWQEEGKPGWVWR